MLVYQQCLIPLWLRWVFLAGFYYLIGDWVCEVGVRGWAEASCLRELATLALVGAIGTYVSSRGRFLGVCYVPWGARFGAILWFSLSLGGGVLHEVAVLGPSLGGL